MTDEGHGGGADDWLRLDRQVCFPLYAATNLMQRLYRPLLTPLGLTYSQYLVLLLLWERESATVGELRDCLYLDAGTITPLLKRMERASLVIRSRDSEDERRGIVTLTPHAVALREAAQRIPETLIGATKGAELHDLTVSLVERLRHLVLSDAA
jgi:DNA-binding MarR family transcriptional regulator